MLFLLHFTQAREIKSTFLANIVFFILVKGFCNRFFFYLIPYGSLKICNQRLKTTFQHQVVLFQH